MNVAYYSGGGRRPPIVTPTRDQLCKVQMSFQGLNIRTPSYGQVHWWETLAWWPELTDRQAAYVAKRGAGDTHAILDLSGSYKELGDIYDKVGADWTNNLPGLVEYAHEAMEEGFMIDLRLAGDGRSAPKNPDGSYPYNDPVGMTYGHEWLMENFPRIADAFGPMYKSIVFVPGYDGVFYGWGDPPGQPDRQPERVQAFGELFRSYFPDGTLGLEFSTGNIPLGEGGGDFQPGGRMKDYDVIYGEFNPWNYHEDSTWQILGRMVHPYNRPPDQPAHDDPNAPYYLATPNPRGPWYFIAFEIITYEWVRGNVDAAGVAAYRQYFADMGCQHIC